MVIFRHDVHIIMREKFGFSGKIHLPQAVMDSCAC